MNLEHFCRHLLFWTLLLALLFWSIISYNQQQPFPVKTVKIVTTYNHLNSQTLRKTVIPYTKHGFFGFDAKGLSNALLQIPWVGSISVQMVWPDKAVISIEEQSAIAKWNDRALINANNEVFIPDHNTFPKGIPQLFGPEEERQNILRQYFLMEKMVNKLGYTITQLIVDQHRSWTLVLNNDLSLFLGQKDVLARVEMFGKIYPKITSNAKQKAKAIDFRYNNGFSIKWQQQN